MCVLAGLLCCVQLVCCSLVAPFAWNDFDHLRPCFCLPILLAIQTLATQPPGFFRLRDGAVQGGPFSLIFCCFLLDDLVVAALPLFQWSSCRKARMGKRSSKTRIKTLSRSWKGVREQRSNKQPEPSCIMLLEPPQANSSEFQNFQWQQWLWMCQGHGRLKIGRVAQLVARVLSMHKVAGSIPAVSSFGGLELLFPKHSISFEETQFCFGPQ